MRILFVTATYPPSVNGVSYQVSILKHELEHLGHTVFVLAPSYPDHDDHDKTVIRYPSFPNPLIKTYPVGVPLINPQVIKKLKPDVIHVHHPSVYGQFAVYLAENLDVPLFFTAHTQYGKYLDEYIPYVKGLTTKLLNSTLKKLGEKCYKVICPSINIQKRLEKIGIKNTVIVSNSIESQLFHRPIKKPLSTPTIIYTGRVAKEKNPMFLIAVAKELKIIMPNFRLVILGEGRLSKTFTNSVRKNNLDHNVVVSKYIERRLLPSIYRSAHLFITPSITEVMPLSILEAMASGLPIIALKGSELEDLIIDGKTGYLLPKNAKEIAKKINYLFKNKKILEKISQESYKHSLNFSVAEKVKALAELYKKAI